MGCLELTIQDYFHVREVGEKTAYSRFSRHVPIDPDGNMLTLSNDGVLWNLTWNGENRLIVAESADKRLEFTYDYMGRRVSKQVYTGSVGNWTLASESKYVYDGWNCIAIFNGSDVMQKSYLWGEDLSGSLQGAGGVGGLLAVSDATATYFPMYDGNGNIMTYVDPSGTLKADYTYDPFGRTISQTGESAAELSYRFSTKPLDTETGLYYYGYRYYSSDLGRWLSRDPIEEKGFQLRHGMRDDGIKGSTESYTFVQNNPISFLDWLGLWKKLGTISDGSRMLYQMESGDTNAGLAKLVGLDENEFDKWAKWEDPAKLDNPSESEKKKRYCGYSVPNVWISIDILRGGSLYQRTIVNPGGTIGRFVGTDIFTYKKVIKADSIRSMMNAIKNNSGNIWGMVAFGHGTYGGDLFVSSGAKIVTVNGKKYLDPSGVGVNYINQSTIRASVASGGYKLAQVYMMQCYSAAGVHKAAWEALTMEGGFTGYTGINVALFDTDWLNSLNPFNWF
jgi:RHS repeat-associated protein